MKNNLIAVKVVRCEGIIDGCDDTSGEILTNVAKPVEALIQCFSDGTTKVLCPRIYIDPSNGKISDECMANNEARQNDFASQIEMMVKRGYDEKELSFQEIKCCFLRTDQRKK